MPEAIAMETDFTIGQGALTAYSRLSYTMWHALAEFIDNSTQSRFNYGSIINDVLKQEQRPLLVEIDHDRINKTITISDNSIGMTRDDLIEGLKIAAPTKDSKGRSKYGMGMKTAACWIGRRWSVVTCEWDSGVEWTAERRGDMTTPDFGEPWRVDNVDGRCIYSDREGYLAEFEDPDSKAQRAISCVNACRGIENPEEVVSLLVEIVNEAESNPDETRLWEMLEKAFGLLNGASPKREGSDV